MFRNGVMPESVSNTVYQFWGTPEYVRIHRAIRDAEIAHGSAAKLLDRSVQPIYKMQNLAAELATDEGESRVLKRLQTIDMARGMMNSITIDAEGEDYDFRSFSYTGVADVIESSCNFLSALTSIPQTKLFGRSPAGMNATGESDMENYYNYVGKIQKLNLKSNLRYLLSVVFQAGVATGEIEEVPKIKIKFNPLWSLSDLEQAQLEQTKSATELTRAQIATTYIQAQVIDPSEVRKKLADTDEFDVEAMLDELDEEELEENDPSKKQQEGGMPGGMGGEMGGMPGMPGMPGGPQEGGGQPGEEQPEMGDKAPEAAPAATKLPQDMSEEEKKEAAEAKHGEKQRTATETEEQPEGEAEQREREENGQVDKPRDSEGTEEAEDEPEEEEDSAEKPLKSNGIHDIMSLREFILQHARKDAESIPKDKVKFRTGENGKAYAIDPETGRTSGLGPDIDRVGVSEKPENNAQKKPEKPGAAAKALTHFSVKDGSVEVSKKIRIKIGRNGRTVLPPQTIGEMEVFAGKGGEKPLEKGEEIAARFGGKPEEWMHVSGIGTVIGKGGVQHRAEIHWFAHDEIGQMGWKVKRWKD